LDLCIGVDIDGTVLPVVSDAELDNDGTLPLPLQPAPMDGFAYMLIILSFLDDKFDLPVGILSTKTSFYRNCVILLSFYSNYTPEDLRFSETDIAAILKEIKVSHEQPLWWLGSYDWLEEVCHMS
jgi:hypothetical protein